MAHDPTEESGSDTTFPHIYGIDCNRQKNALLSIHSSELSGADLANGIRTLYLLSGHQL
jgi:hypothetical protein